MPLLITSKDGRLRAIIISLTELFLQHQFAKGRAMISSTASDRLTEQGVRFHVALGFSLRECIVSKDALMYLAASQDPELDFNDVYLRHEDRIYKAAQRLVNAGAKAEPLMLNSWSFR